MHPFKFNKKKSRLHKLLQYNISRFAVFHISSTHTTGIMEFTCDINTSSKVEVKELGAVLDNHFEALVLKGVTVCHIKVLEV